MTRWWTEFVAAVERVVALPLVLLLLLGAATLVALLWYYFPAWVPRRWPRLRRPAWRRPRLRWPALPRWRWQWQWRWPGWAWLRRLARWAWRWSWRRRPRTQAQAQAPAEAPAAAADQVPEVPAAEFASLADRLAAEGRYAEAIRERLRGMVRHLIERGILEHRPGWTVTELAVAAAARRPAVAAPLGEASRIFSDVWYGDRPADAGLDARMRDLAGALATSLDAPHQVPVGVGR
jgi:hypothetical protein